MHSTERLIQKLQITTPLNADDLRALEQLPIHIKEVAAHTAIVREGERPSQCCLLVDGFICRSKNDGCRQAANPLDSHLRRHPGFTEPASARHGPRHDDALSMR